MKLRYCNDTTVLKPKKTMHPPKSHPMTTPLNFDARQEAAWANTANLRSADHPVVKMFTRQRVEQIRSMLGTFNPDHALDVGCGDGFGMEAFRDLCPEIHGCDRSPQMLKMNPALADRLTQCDAYQLPYEDNRFDLVYCTELLHHIARPVEVVKEMARVSKRAVLICEPNCFNPAMALFGSLLPHERGLLRFTPAYPRRLLLEAGFQKAARTTCSWFTPNRTPLWMAKTLSKLPYKIPGLGLYTITVAFKASPSNELAS